VQRLGRHQRLRQQRIKGHTPQIAVWVSHK
jgi:hypothetical protein